MLYLISTNKIQGYVSNMENTNNELSLKQKQSREKKYLMKESSLDIDITPYKYLASTRTFSFKIVAKYELAIRNTNNRKLIQEIIVLFKKSQKNIQYYFEEYKKNQHYGDMNIDDVYMNGEKSYRNIMKKITDESKLFPFQNYDSKLKDIYCRDHVFDKTIFDVISTIYEINLFENHDRTIDYDNLLDAIKKNIAKPNMMIKHKTIEIKLYQIYDKVYIESVKTVKNSKIIYIEIIQAIDINWSPDQINKLWIDDVKSYDDVLNFLAINGDRASLVSSNFDFGIPELPFMMGAKFEEITMNKNFLFYSIENMILNNSFMNSFDFVGFGLLDNIEIEKVKKDGSFKHIKNILKKKHDFIQDLFVYDWFEALGKFTTNSVRLKKVEDAFIDIPDKIKKALDITPPSTKTLQNRQLLFTDGIEKNYYRYF